jgi:energy-coupling factor transport system permease protein
VSVLVPTYRRTGSTLHAARASVAILYVCAACSVALFYDHPLMLGGAIAGVVGAGIAAGLGPEIARGARLAAPLALLVALVNPLVSREGLTLLAQGPVVPVLGRLDITLEAILYGGVAALRVLLVALAFSLYSAAIDPDELLRGFRRLSLRSSLTASLATRLVPVLGRDAERLSDAYVLRAAVPATAGGRGERLRRAAILSRALVAGALERAVDVAAALEVRGYAAASRVRRREHLPWSRHDLAFAAAALSVVSLVLVGLVAGLGSFEAYPGARMDTGFGDWLIVVAVPAAMLSPFVAARLMRA